MDIGRLFGRRAKAAGRLLPAALLLAALAGCAILGREATQDDPFSSSSRFREGPVRIEIQNDNFNDARIYVHWRGTRERVGLVVGKTTGVLETQWRADELRVEVDLIAGGGFVTDAIAVWPGETLFLQILPGP